MTVSPVSSLPPRSLAALRAKIGGFTLIELLVVVAVIGVMTALIVAMVANSAEDARRVLARQQQAVVQEAVNAWIASQTMTNSVLAARTAYNASANRFSLVTGYLDQTTYEHFTNYTTTATQPRTEAMAKLGQYLELPVWSNNAYPRVNMLP